jgi:protein-glutamine gamma-glutamyltransferase
MSFSLLHKCVAYLLSGLGLLALSLGSELTEPSLLLMVFGFLTSWFAEGKLLTWPRYATAWTGAVVSFLLIQVARAVLNGPTLAMAIEFAAFLQISRLYNRRSAADYQQIAVLAFLHLIAATVLSTNLGYAVIFGGFLIATPWMLALSHLRREIEGNYPPQDAADPAARSAILRVLASKRVVGPGFLVGTALLSLPLFAMTLAIFVIVPRVGQGFLSFRRDGGQRVAGFGNQVELGGFGVIRDDPTVVLRVMPMPRKDQQRLRALRLRGTSFDHYDGRRWKRSESALRDARQQRTVYPIRRMPDLERDEQLRIVLEHLDEPVVFIPAGTVAIAVPPRISGGINVSRELSYAPGLDLRYESSDGVGLVYTAYVSRDPAEADLAAMPTEHRANYLQVPKGHERVAELARQVVGDADTDLERARRVERFLRSGEIRYSLTQPDVGKRLPLEVFLFDAKRGHCEYFSSAMAVMLRTLGIATRNVAGFAGGRYNAYGQYYALRQGDAHSWVEVYVRGRGWVTFDPTPSARGSAGPRERLWSDITAMIDALRTRWTTSVVGYDLRTQVGMLQRMARWFAQFRSERAAGAERSQSEDSETGSGPAWSVAARWLAALLAAGIVLYVVLRKGRLVTRIAARPASRRQAQLIALYWELDRALAKRGHPRPVSLTPLEHALGLGAAGFEQSAEVEAVTRRYLEARYGERPLNGAEVSELRKIIARVRKAA